MKNVTKFDKPTLKTLRAEMQAVLDKFGANLEFEVGNMSFNETEVTIKVKAKVKGAKTRSDSLLEDIMKMYKLKSTAVNGDTLIEYNSRSYKYPFVYRKASDGKLYKTDITTAKARFAA